MKANQGEPPTVKRKSMSVKKFMTTLNYASCNEDWRSEWHALKIAPDDRILCITGSGDRPLNLLPKNPNNVISMDNNPMQNHLLRLKMAAIKELPYNEYSSFLGLNNGLNRMESWLKIRNNLPKESRRFWDHHTILLEKGIIYQGRWEKHLRKLAFIAKLIRPTTIKKLFEIENMEEQKRFIELEWDKWWWRLTFDILGRATFSRIFFGDPGFYQNVNRNMNIGRYVYENMKQYLKNYLAKKNFMLSLMFESRLNKHDLPPYLDFRFIEEIKKRMAKIEIKTGNILNLLESVKENSFTKYSFSDIPSFLNQDEFERLLSGIVRSAAPGARFCIRQFLTDHEVPDKFKRDLVREPDLEDYLERKDSSFAYRFIVGSVMKTL